MEYIRAAGTLFALMLMVLFLKLSDGYDAGASGEEQNYRISAPEGWEEHLPVAADGKSFALAAISADASGADFSWEYAEDREGLLDLYRGKKTVIGKETEKDRVPWFFLKMKLNQIHGTDLWEWLQQNREKGYRYIPCADERGEGYYFLQSFEEAQEQRMTGEEQILIIKDGFCYLFECSGVTAQTKEAVSARMLHFRNQVLTGSRADRDWEMDAEALYWIDHDRRVTSDRNPEREFVEVRARGTDWPHLYKRPFGLVKEAHFQVKSGPKLPEMTVSFYFQEEISEEGYEASLQDGVCMDTRYRMEIRQADGRLIQEEKLELCFDDTDRVSFADLDGDGFTDMQIGNPANGWGTAIPAEGIFLWNQDKERFERTTEEPEYRVKVKRGDSLWRIAERIYGDGTYYWSIYEKNRQRIGDNPSFLSEGMELELP